MKKYDKSSIVKLKYGCEIHWIKLKDDAEKYDKQLVEMGKWYGLNKVRMTHDKCFKNYDVWRDDYICDRCYKPGMEKRKLPSVSVLTSSSVTLPIPALACFSDVHFTTTPDNCLSLLPSVTIPATEYVCAFTVYIKKVKNIILNTILFIIFFFWT